MTVNDIQQAMNKDNWWLHPKSSDATIINYAISRGWLKKLSHSQVEWVSEEKVISAKNYLNIKH